MSIASDARFWDKTSPRYAKSKVSDNAAWERSLERTRGLLKPGDRVLELGCGTGSSALRLADAVEHYLATDISAGMVSIGNEKLAAEKAAGRDLPSLSFRAATAEDLSPADGPFDAVLGFNYLHLVRDQRATLASIHALLRDGGLFISKTVCLGEMNALLRLVAVPLMQMVGQAPHVDALTASEVAKMIEEAGFEIIANERHGTKSKDARPYIVARKR